MNTTRYFKSVNDFLSEQEDAISVEFRKHKNTKIFSRNVESILIPTLIRIKHILLFFNSFRCFHLS